MAVLRRAGSPGHPRSGVRGGGPVGRGGRPARRTYQAGGTWATQTLPGKPAPGTTIAATTTAGGPRLPAAEVFYIDQAGQPAETYQQGNTWMSRTVPGPAADRTALALADSAHGGSACVRLYYIGRHGSLISAPAGGCGPAVPLGLPGVSVAARSSLAAVSTGPGGVPRCLRAAGGHV